MAMAIQAVKTAAPIPGVSEVPVACPMLDLMARVLSARSPGGYVSTLVAMDLDEKFEDGVLTAAEVFAALRDAELQESGKR